MRVGSEADQGELAESGSYLHQVSGYDSAKRGRGGVAEAHAADAPPAHLIASSASSGAQLLRHRKARTYTYLIGVRFESYARVSCRVLARRVLIIHRIRSMTAAYLDTQPHLLEKWASLNPLGRIGRPDELRGVVAWLASDASTFCTGSE